MSQPYRRGHLRLLTCTSQKLNPAERNYPTHERKMRALVHAIKTWKHYLMGSKVLAYTDNVALRYWKTAQNLSPHHVCGIAYIGMIDMDIAHISGITNTAADAISQLASHALCCPVIGSHAGDWKDAYKLDPRTRAEHFDSSGDFANTNAYYYSRLWDHDRIVVPRSNVRTLVFFADIGVPGRPLIWWHANAPGVCLCLTHIRAR